MLYSPGHASLKVKVRFGGKAPELLCVCGGIQIGGCIKRECTIRFEFLY